MPMSPQAKMTVVAEFPPHYFLENLAACEDGSFLATVQNRRELWRVPPRVGSDLASPQLLHTFEFNTTFVVEWKPGRFLLGVADVYETLAARLYEIDMRGWTPDRPIAPRRVLDFPQPFAGLNGGCLLAPNVLLAAGVKDQIWRVDLADDGSAEARIWLQHDSMKNRPGEKKPEQPGTNGVQYAARSHFLYYTTTSQQMMLRVKVDPATLAPADLPEFVAGGRQWDDFLIDEDGGVAYVTTHRDNTLDRVRLARDGARDGRTVVAGDPFDAGFVGPSAAVWGRAPGDYGRIAYVSTDGGTAAPPDGVFRPAKLLRLELPPVPEPA